MAIKMCVMGLKGEWDFAKNSQIRIELETFSIMGALYHCTILLPVIFGKLLVVSLHCFSLKGSHGIMKHIYAASNYDTIRD